ncbi:UNVERIFIED_CONTAM: Retrovirus-related Pol polyprotein from transposon TNT 1-94 [Sesamum calycinum]|uniref:Retrovirus-related Pol polyprotein from transposon TNT 1-94 n=1 Tax=Sesamum calycinum TaxID=2727403 RepID=A0AAW2KNA6_9LAMI
MKGILIQQKVFKAIDGKYADNVSEDKKLENDEYAYSSIILNLSDSVIRKVGKQISAKMLWDKLEELYTETSFPSKLFLLEKFFRYKLDMSKNIDENIDEFTKLIQDIKLTGDKNIDDYSPIVLLNAISETYGDVKAAIKYGRDNVQLETVISGLKNKKKEYKCYNCGGRGHFIKDCKKLKKNKESANLTEEVYDEVYMISDVNSVKSVLNKKEWIVDSGCTFHMTPFRDILSNYKTEKLGCVSMANEKLCAVHGLGDVCMIFENGFKLTLKNVRHVPDLAQNLISCSALEEEGLEGKWGKGVMKILKGSLTVFKAERKRNLYVCSVDYDFHAASVVHPNVSDLWHKRHKTTPYPQQNGVAERMNRTLLNKVRCLLISSGLSKTFWGEALSTAVYLINRSPSVPLLGKIPEYTSEPFSYEEAIESKNSENWIKAMNDEIDSLNKNRTWTLVPKPKDVTTVDCLPHWEALKWLLRHTPSLPKAPPHSLSLSSSGSPPSSSRLLPSTINGDLLFNSKVGLWQRPSVAAFVASGFLATRVVVCWPLWLEGYSGNL